MRDTYYKVRYDSTKNTTIVAIVHNGFRVMSLEFYGQLSAAAIKQYALEAAEILKEKGVLKGEINGLYERKEI